MVGRPPISDLGPRTFFRCRICTSPGCYTSANTKWGCDRRRYCVDLVYLRYLRMERSAINEVRERPNSDRSAIDHARSLDRIAARLDRIFVRA